MVSRRQVGSVGPKQVQVGVDEVLGEGGRGERCLMHQIALDLVRFGGQTAVALDESPVEVQQQLLVFGARASMLVVSWQHHGHHAAQLHAPVQEEVECRPVAARDGHPDGPGLLEDHLAHVGSGVDESIHDLRLHLARRPPGQGDRMMPVDVAVTRPDGRHTVVGEVVNGEAEQRVEPRVVPCASKHLQPRHSIGFCPPPDELGDLLRLPDGPIDNALSQLLGGLVIDALEVEADPDAARAHPAAGLTSLRRTGRLTHCLYP
mmetsp:Transcript_4878/g.13212  ORF Transcript_4878/g.13212 Transcript_4878/m.13212 type:complete len:262 (-) Transcript_4878:185-970(-)